MSTKIEWADDTWNPTTGCTKVSPGCAHCYIERQPPMRVAGRKFVRGNIPIVLHPDRLDKPLRRRKPTRYFVNSMSDLFHEEVPDEFIVTVFAVMSVCFTHTFQVLTKRPKRMLALLSADDFRRRVRDAHGQYNAAARAGKAERHREAGLINPEYRVGLDAWPLDNVWLGVSVENQRFADERIPILLQTPAAVRFISAEPLLGPVDFDSPEAGGLHVLGCGDPLCGCVPWLDWVIVGGESGPKHRPFDPEWARAIVQQCRAAGVAVFIKQLGGARPGNALEDLPDDLRVREFPEREGR